MKRRASLVLVFACLVGPAVAQTHSVPQPHPGGAPPEAPVTRELLLRGQERYDIFCTPCHGFSGHGDGMAVERGFPAPPSFHEGPQRDLTAPRIVDVITEGTGRMLPMAERIPPFDRWAIAAYVKALQLSQQPEKAEP